jgi:hypothetical protein
MLLGDTSWFLRKEGGGLCEAMRVIFFYTDSTPWIAWTCSPACAKEAPSNGPGGSFAMERGWPGGRHAPLLFSPWRIDIPCSQRSHRRPLHPLFLDLLGVWR